MTTLLTEEDLKMLLDPLRANATDRVLAHNAALVADNAALVDMLRMAQGDLIVAYCLPHETATGPIPELLAKPHPGAELLAELERHRDAVQWALARFQRMGDLAAVMTMTAKLAHPDATTPPKS